MKTLGQDFDNTARKVYAVASGALGNGKAVVVNADGTVSFAGSTSRSQSLGTPVVFDNGAMNYTATTFDSNSNKIVVAWRDHNNSFRGTAAVGTIDTSDNSISFGSDAVFETGDTIKISATFDNINNKVVIGYVDAGNNSYGTAVIGTVSGTSISFGTPVVFESAAISTPKLIHVPTTKDNGSGTNLSFIGTFYTNAASDGKIRKGTVSGTSISFTSSTEFSGGDSVGSIAVALATNVSTNAEDPHRIVLAYKDLSNSSIGKANVVKINNAGVSVTHNDAVTFESGGTEEISTVFDTTNSKALISFTDEGDSNHGKSVVGTLTLSSASAVGTIATGSANTFHSAATYRTTSVYDPTSKKVLIAYSDASTSNGGTFVMATISGTSVTHSSETAFEAGEAGSISTAYDSNADRIVISYEDETDSDQGNSVVVQTAATVINLTSENYIGITPNAYPDDAGAEIQTKGAVNEEQSGLTAGQSYFVQTDGTLGTTADDPSVFAGTAVSATKIIVKG